MTSREILHRLKKNDIKEIFLKNNLKRVYLVGSYARGEQNEKSDIDLVYDIDSNIKFSLFDLIILKNSLEEKMLKNVDLVDGKSVNKHYKKYIENDKILIFN